MALAIAGTPDNHIQAWGNQSLDSYHIYICCHHVMLQSLLHGHSVFNLNYWELLFFWQVITTIPTPKIYLSTTLWLCLSNILFLVPWLCPATHPFWLHIYAHHWLEEDFIMKLQSFLGVQSQLFCSESSSMGCHVWRPHSPSCQPFPGIGHFLVWCTCFCNATHWKDFIVDAVLPSHASDILEIIHMSGHSFSNMETLEFIVYKEVPGSLDFWEAFSSRTCPHLCKVSLQSESWSRAHLLELLHATPDLQSFSMEFPERLFPQWDPPSPWGHHSCNASSSYSHPLRMLPTHFLKYWPIWLSLPSSTFHSVTLGRIFFRCQALVCLYYEW